MGIFTIMKMELKFISSQGSTAFLILLYPLVLMMVVGPIFTSIGAKGVLIAVHTELSDPLPVLESQFVYLVKSKPDMIREVLSGKAVMGLSMEMDQNGKRHMYAYYTPGKEIVANALALQLQGKFSDISATHVETNLIAIWRNMKSLSTDIDAKLVKIPIVRNSLMDSKNRMAGLKSSMDAGQSASTDNSLNSMDADIGSMSSSISELQGKVNSWESAANEFSNYDSKLAYYDSRLQATDNQLASLQGSLSPWDTRLAARILQLDSAYNSLFTYLAVIQQVKATSSGSTYDSLSQVEAGMQDSMNQISSARSELSQMRSELSSMLSQIQSARSEIASSRSDIAQTRQQLSVTNANMRRDITDVRSKLSDATSKLGSARGNIAKARNSLGNYGALANSMSTYLAQSANEIDSLLVELSGTESLLRNAKQNIDKFISEDPQSFVPTKIETLQEGRKLRAIDSMFPSLIGLVSMLSCLLLPPIISVKQRAQGIRSRMKLSYASPFSIIVGKFLGDYLVGLIQVLIVTLLGSIVFGIYLGSNFSAIALALFLAPAVFTSMGTLLSAFVSKEGSAVLSTLLFSMPMLFLSGILLPIEQIHGSVRTLTEYLPLYNIVEMISKVTIRDAPAYMQSNFEICLGYLAVFLLFAYFAGRNAD